MAPKIDYGLTFNFWVRAVLKNILRIISLAKNRNARYLKKNHKFVVEVTKSTKHALEFGKKNVKIFWSTDISCQPLETPL